MAVSPLIMVRFEKFEIVCTQDFGPDLADVRMTSRVTSFAPCDVVYDVFNRELHLVHLFETSFA